ncbi:hypothetical protein AWV80_33230 [Cupriavidus sp. UYMU48A]|nr:hypothetical protein AWV80_33230 [Cupriavidus sp. UYMU48A]
MNSIDSAVAMSANVQSSKLDPITVAVIGSALSTIAEEMGKAVIRAAYSTNIKERQDCSTALFDKAGNTIAQAEHIPIHLGSLLGIAGYVLEHHDMSTIRLGTCSSAMMLTQAVARTWTSQAVCVASTTWSSGSGGRVSRPEIASGSSLPR